jgi:hypothetical protein
MAAIGKALNRVALASVALGAGGWLLEQTLYTGSLMSFPCAGVAAAALGFGPVAGLAAAAAVLAAAYRAVGTRRRVGRLLEAAAVPLAAGPSLA